MQRPERSDLRLATLAFAAVAALGSGVARAEQALAPAPHPEDDYAETFTFVADLDDGSYVQAQLGVTNLGPASGTGFCRALVHRPEGRPWAGSSRFGRRWSHGVDGPAERLEVGTCAAESGPAGTTVRATLSGRVIVLEFPRPAAAPGEPAAEVEVGGRRYRSWILQPPGPATVRLEGFGPAVVLAGGGFADHSRSTVPYRKLARSWVRFRALRGDRPVVVLARQAPDGSWGPAWVRRGDTSSEPLSGVQVAHTAGATAFKVALAGEHSGLITSGAAIYRFSSLSELGLLGKMVAPFVGNSVTYTQRASLSPPGEPPIDGVLEVSVFEE